MKKLFTILVVLFSMNVTAQQLQQKLMMGLTANKFNVDAENASNMGYGFIMSFNKIYFDFTGNFANGEGEYLEFSSSSTYAADKVSIIVMNFGYIINFKKAAIIPIIGWGRTGDIYQDPIGWDTYFIKSKSHINIGLIGLLNVNEKVAIQAGYGLFDGIKIGISFKVM